jgi:ABC-type antimicrobial peptide transport system permease subunit
VTRSRTTAASSASHGRSRAWLDYALRASAVALIATYVSVASAHEQTAPVPGPQPHAVWPDNKPGTHDVIVPMILVAVLFTMLLVAANTMAQSVRERTSEVGVLKTLGFSNGSILALILGESVLIAIIGGTLGLGLAWLFVQNGDPTNGMLPVFMLPSRDMAIGAALIVVLGLAAGALPALTAMNLKITDALRRS